jgi:hypothetical protein
MSRVLVHMAVPGAKRQLAATMAGLSGLPTEHSVECEAVPGGASAQWDTAQGYDGTWWAASQAFAPAIAQSMLQSGYMLGTESWFVARFEDNGTLIDHNLPVPPVDASFDAFLVAAGLARVEPNE